MSVLRVEGPAAVRGQVRVPGDKSISHRALLLAALAEGESRIRGLADGEDVAATRAAVEALGAGVTLSEAEVLVVGGHLREAPRVIWVGNSGTGIRLLAGLCAGLPFLSVLEGDASLARRPMDRIATPLRAMGARIDGRDRGRFPPLVVRGGELRGIDYELPVPSAQVKGAVLLAGLHAEGRTVVREGLATRAHTEEMLAAAGASVRLRDGAVELEASRLDPLDLTVPGDPSQAAFWLAAACLLPDSDVTVPDVYVGPARLGFVDVLRRMGAAVEVGDDGVIRARSSELRGCEVAPEEIPSMVDEIPILAVAAAAATGTTRFSGVGELRVKESDRVQTVASELGAFGARVEVGAEELVVHGGGRLQAATVRSHGDHRIAMAMAVAGLAAEGSTIVEDVGCIATSYPRFEADLRALTGAGEHWSP